MSAPPHPAEKYQAPVKILNFDRRLFDIL